MHFKYLGYVVNGGRGNKDQIKKRYRKGKMIASVKIRRKNI